MPDDAPKQHAWPNLREDTASLGPFRFASGETLPDLRLRYLTFGTPIRDASGAIANAVLLLHATLGKAENWLLPGLANPLFGAGGPLDAARHYLILPDAIGHGGSSRPSEGLRARFPHYRYADIVEASHRLVADVLGMARLRLVGGISMGAMLAWMWAAAHPDSAEAYLAIGSLPEAMGGRSWAIRRTIIETIRNDPDWRGGEYDTNPRLHAYVTPLLFLLATGRAVYARHWTGIEAGDRSYARLVEHARSLDANDCLYGIEAVIDYDPVPGLERITAPFLTINFADDDLLPPDAAAIQAALKRVRKGTGLILRARGAGHGHYTYNQGEVWAPHLAKFMAALPARDPA